MQIFAKGNPEDTPYWQQRAQRTVQEACEGVERADDCSRSPKAQVYWAPGLEFRQGPRQKQS